MSAVEGLPAPPAFAAGLAAAGFAEAAAGFAEAAALAGSFSAGFGSGSVTIFNAAGQSVFSNNDWSTPAAGAASAAELATAATRAGAIALSANSRDAALLVQLDPGAYTAVVSDASGATGVSLVEVHEVP
jgi:hypothetical protein